MFRVNALSIIFSITLHIGVIALMSASWQSADSAKRVMPPPNYVKATLVELKSKAKKATQVKKKPNKINLEKKQQQIERQAKQAEQKRQAAIKQKQAEEKRKLEQELQRVEQEKVRKKKELDEQRAIATQRQFEQALLEEEGQLLEDSYATEAMAWQDLLAQRIERNWSRPQSARNGMRCEISLDLVPNGHVVNVSIIKSSGDAAFDRSAVAAVRKAEPFPEIKDIPPEVFERFFRKFTLVFNPLDRRL